MSEMVERVAEALRRLPIRDRENPGSELDGLRLREASRAVIEAMREPTKEMDGAGDMDSFYMPAGVSSKVWRQMINAALGKVDA